MPSSVPTTRQPYGLNQSSGAPFTTDELGRLSMPKSFQSIKKTRFESPRPHAEFLASWLTPVVRPPSPSTQKTFTSPHPAHFSASASPTAGAIPCPDGPVLYFRKSDFPCISAWPGKPPLRRSSNRSSQDSAHRPCSGNSNHASPPKLSRARMVSLNTARTE